VAVKETFGVFRLSEWAGALSAPTFGAPAGRRPGAKKEKKRLRKTVRHDRLLLAIFCISQMLSV